MVTTKFLCIFLFSLKTPKIKLNMFLFVNRLSVDLNLAGDFLETKVSLNCLILKCNALSYLSV